MTLAYRPRILPLGDSAILVRFADKLDDLGNRAAVGFSRHLEDHPIPGVLEIMPNLVSVLLRYDATTTGFDSLAGEVRLAIAASDGQPAGEETRQEIEVEFGGEAGPDLGSVASALNMSVDEFIQAHNASDLRVLATGFAPGFVYCGLHDQSLRLERRRDVRSRVPAGSVLFAAGQTAIAATPIPTGWHVIGRTGFRNFDPEADPPTMLRAGQRVKFRSARG
ncbi:MAG TPA: allophanate hydrolase subunit 1 [Devosiaceae bacterium]